MVTMFLYKIFPNYFYEVIGIVIVSDYKEIFNMNMEWHEKNK